MRSQVNTLMLMDLIIANINVAKAKLLRVLCKVAAQDGFR
jgi:hypothetical protein